MKPTALYAADIDPFVDCGVATGVTTNCGISVAQHLACLCSGGPFSPSLWAKNVRFHTAAYLPLSHLSILFRGHLSSYLKAWTPNLEDVASSNILCRTVRHQPKASRSRENHVDGHPTPGNSSLHAPDLRYGVAYLCIK
jgi:hypothetical protein